MRILVVDWRPTEASRVGECLERNGHRVDYAASPLLGARLASTGRFNAIVIAAEGSEEEALAAVRQLRTAHSKPRPILMLATEAVPDEPEGEIWCAPDHFLHMPYRPADVGAILGLVSRLVRNGHGAAAQRLRCTM
jgi:DNA-binding response OmpR family regulator